MKTHIRNTPYLEGVPCYQLQTDQGVKEFGQTEAYVSISVAVCVISPPHFKMGFDAVKRVKILHHVLKYFLTFPDDPVWMGHRASVRHELNNVCQIIFDQQLWSILLY